MIKFTELSLLVQRVHAFAIVIDNINVFLQSWTQFTLSSTTSTIYKHLFAQPSANSIVPFYYICLSDWVKNNFSLKF